MGGKDLFPDADFGLDEYFLVFLGMTEPATGPDIEDFVNVITLLPRVSVEQAARREGIFEFDAFQKDAVAE
jgi:hypothetical protein